MPNDDRILMGFRRTPSSHKYCFICKSRSDLHVVKFDIRSAVLEEASIYIPNGTRTCEADIIVIVERGFRDVVQFIKNRGFRLLMPPMRGTRKQVPVDEANEGRRVTKLRWVVEAVHGVLKMKFGFLRKKIDNKLLPKLGALCQVVGYLHNRYGKRLWGADSRVMAQIDRMEARFGTPNTLGEQVEADRWNLRPTTLERIAASDLLDFPMLTEEDLFILTTGQYQLELAGSYLAEILDENDDAELKFLRQRRLWSAWTCGLVTVATNGTRCTWITTLREIRSIYRDTLGS